MEAEDQEIYDKSFIEEPAILDKHKAAAAICDGKLFKETNERIRYEKIDLSIYK